LRHDRIAKKPIIRTGGRACTPPQSGVVGDSGSRASQCGQERPWPGQFVSLPELRQTTSTLEGPARPWAPPWAEAQPRAPAVPLKGGWLGSSTRDPAPGPGSCFPPPCAYLARTAKNRFPGPPFLIPRAGAAPRSPEANPRETPGRPGPARKNRSHLEGLPPRRTLGPAPRPQRARHWLAAGGFPNSPNTSRSEGRTRVRLGVANSCKTFLGTRPSPPNWGNLDSRPIGPCARFSGNMFGPLSRPDLETGRRGWPGPPSLCPSSRNRRYAVNLDSPGPASFHASAKLPPMVSRNLSKTARVKGPRKGLRAANKAGPCCTRLLGQSASQRGTWRKSFPRVGRPPWEGYGDRRKKCSKGPLAFPTRRITGADPSRGPENSNPACYSKHGPAASAVRNAKRMGPRPNR